MAFEFEVYCNDCGSSNASHIGCDEQTETPIFVCEKCGIKGSFGIEFSYLEII